MKSRRYDAAHWGSWLACAAHLATRGMCANPDCVSCAHSSSCLVMIDFAVEHSWIRLQETYSGLWWRAR